MYATSLRSGVMTSNAWPVAYWKKKWSRVKSCVPCSAPPRRPPQHRPTTVRAMILAAGLGSRLRPLTTHLPKPLVPILNRPLLWHLIRRIKQAGIHEIAINLHYRGEQIRRWLGHGEHLGVEMYVF